MKYLFLSSLAAILCITGLVFALTIVNTTLGILPPAHQIMLSPSHATWTLTSGFVYVSMTGEGIRQNSTWIRDNGTYTLTFYRGTGPFITGAGYSTGNTWSPLQTTLNIDRIDNTLPTFAGVTNGSAYDHAVTITFSDNLPGITATINGTPFTDGSSITTNGTYQLIVKDAVGNTTWATFIIYLQTTPSGWWGWGGWSAIGAWQLTKHLCETRNCYSYYYDDICGPCTIEKEEHEETPLPIVRPPYHYTNPIPVDIHDSEYPKERNDAYVRAYSLGITTIPNINDADLEGVLYRKFAAKMASEFAIKVVWRTPDESKSCDFSDTADEDPEMQYYIRLSCKLGIMGLDYYGNPDTVFNPNYVVTRDQFVTIISRILFQGQYNLETTELSFFDKMKNFAVHTLNNVSNALWLNISINTRLDRYTKHMEAIRKLWIITDYRISLKEFRSFVMLIMYRINKLGIENIQNILK